MHQNNQTKQPSDDSSSTKITFFRRTDVIVVAIILLIAGVWLAYNLNRPTGAVALISVSQPDGTNHVQRVPLSKNQIIHVEGTPFPVTLQVQDGTIAFVNAQCPDHQCEQFGALSQEGEWALCAPAGVMVQIEQLH